MKLDCDLFQEAFTQWLFKEIEESEGKDRRATFCRNIGIETKSSKGRTLRRAKENNPRKWKLTDICKIGRYWNIEPSRILADVELYYDKNILGLKKMMNEKLQKKEEKKSKKLSEM